MNLLFLQVIWCETNWENQFLNVSDTFCHKFCVKILNGKKFREINCLRFFLKKIMSFNQSFIDDLYDFISTV